MFLKFKKYKNTFNSILFAQNFNFHFFFKKNFFFHGVHFKNNLVLVFKKKKILTKATNLFGFFYHDINYSNSVKSNSAFLKNIKRNELMSQEESLFNSFLSTQVYHLFLLPFWLKLTSYCYAVFFLSKNNYKYKSSFGNYLIYYSYNFTQKLCIFFLPSKKELILPNQIFIFKGRRSYKLSNLHKPSYMKYLLKKKTVSVRGVAMNPVDHHNGGRTTRKPLFLNKYNKVAKFNK